MQEERYTKKFKNILKMCVKKDKKIINENNEGLLKIPQSCDVKLFMRFFCEDKISRD